jgi:predicted PurR-regulated permease PerM
MNQILLRINLYLLLFALLTVVLYFGKPILIPILLGAMFAMLMAPVCGRLDKIGMSRGLSSFIGLLIVFASLLIIFGVGIWQVALFIEDLPLIEQRTTELLTKIQDFVEETFSIPSEDQVAIIQKQFKALSASAGTYVGKILTSFSSTIAWLVLTLVFTYLFLYNRERYESFFLKLFKNEEPEKVKAVVTKISHVAQHYLTGRAISVIILFVFYAIGLLIIGIKNALLLAAIGALLTVIPYVGTILGGLFPVLMALLTESSFVPAIWAGVVMVTVQALDNYFVEPYVVGGEVNLSALATIIIIVCGGLLWGTFGMILFIPLLGIAKIICDNVESLKPYGYLIGDPESKKPTSHFRDWLNQKLGKMKSRKVKT